LRCIASKRRRRRILRKMMRNREEKYKDEYNSENDDCLQ